MWHFFSGVMRRSRDRKRDSSQSVLQKLSTSRGGISVSRTLLPHHVVYPSCCPFVFVIPLSEVTLIIDVSLFAVFFTRIYKKIEGIVFVGWTCSAVLISCWSSFFVMMFELTVGNHWFVMHDFVFSPASPHMSCLFHKETFFRKPSRCVCCVNLPDFQVHSCDRDLNLCCLCLWTFFASFQEDPLLLLNNKREKKTNRSQHTDQAMNRWGNPWTCIFPDFL